MNINLVYSKFAIELNDDSVNHIILDCEQALDLPVPLMLKDSDVNVKNLQLHAVLTQLTLLTNLIASGVLLDKDTSISLINTKLLGKYLHMQVLGYLKNNINNVDGEVVFLGYPNDWETSITEKFSKIGNNLHYYFIPKVVM